ncbi:COG4223 family protein [Enterovirga sp. CN4-39]|uniref:COG4223 family protein n=1 Tax=Enterovirga sp. CN4-39 TaxID=3400910 RepID=UPI003C0E24F3
MIDLPKAEFSSSQQADASVADEVSEAQTAIEPIAATGLDGAAKPQAAKPQEVPVAEAAPAPNPTPDEEIPTDAPAAPADSPALDTAPVGGTTSSVPPIPPPPPAPEKRSASGVIAASLIGGVVGAAFAVGADIYWRQPPADYESRLAALETRPQPAAPAPGVAQPANEALEGRIGTLENQVRSLTDTVAAARSAAEGAERQVAELASRPAPAEPAPATPAPPQTDPAVREDLDRLGSRLDAVDGRLAQAAPSAAIDELKAALQNAQNGAEERQRAVTAAIGAVQAATTGLDGHVQANGEAIAKLSAEVAKLPPSLLQAALRAVVAGQIGQDLRGGRPLGPALSALERLGTSGPAVEALRPFAAQAAPSAQALAAEFKPLADKITEQPQGPSGSIADRLMRVAEKVVTVRAVGDGSGRDVPGLVGRIEAALNRGALGEAAAAWESLPDEPRRVSAEWGARLKARIAADNAARTIGAESLAALDAPSR